MAKLCIKTPSEFEDAFEQIRSELEVPTQFPDQVVEEVKNLTPMGYERTDRTDIKFIAIDPEGSIDLDQAFYAEKDSSGYTIFYAIADPAEFVKPGGATDIETNTRGVTLYSPDLRTPLHPTEISEDKASLLEKTRKPALLWEIDLDKDGSETNWKLSRCLVQVDRAISYKTAQTEIDSDTSATNSPLQLLKEIGQLRQIQEKNRGGISVNLPAQQITKVNGFYELEFEVSLPVENWNAQISLLTGMVAAKTLLKINTGILRNLPKATDETITTLRNIAKALDLDWPKSTNYAEFVRSIQPDGPNQIAFLNQATRSFRGAGYINLATAKPETDLLHHAIASPYAHVTAPLRRLVDRYNNEILLAHFASEPTPSWVTDVLDKLPGIMGKSKQKASSLERAVLDLAETMILENKVGNSFEAFIIDKKRYKDEEKLIIQIKDPAIVSSIPSNDELTIGQKVTVQLSHVDIKKRITNFEVVKP